MRTWIMALALAISSAGGVAVAQDDAPDGDTGVMWVERPTAEIYDQYYPPFAMFQNVVGRVVLMCVVLADATHTCTIEEETAQGWGFGEAAIAISHSFRFQPMQREGIPVSGGRVRVPVNFRFPRQRPVTPFDTIIAPDQPAFSDPPIWEEAPNFLAVMRLYPQAALRQQVRGRALLSCLIDQERRLDCRTEMEMPANHGFGAAALELSRQFRVSESDTERLARHRREQMLLPINFGPSREMTPVAPLTGAAPLEFRFPIPMDAPVYPASARNAGVGGVAQVLCTYSADTQCVLEREEPDIWSFGDASLTIARAFPFETLADFMPVLEGDQLRFQFHYLAP